MYPFSDPAMSILRIRDWDHYNHRITFFGWDALRPSIRNDGLRVSGSGSEGYHN